MATDAQTEANRRNARLSTGPKTEEGKAASRGNARTHGLAGSGVVLEPDEAEEVARRTAEWAAVFRPVGAVEAFQVAQYALESVRVERCQAQERALRVRSAVRARDPRGWDEDRRLDAEETAARLARDPARTVRRLRQSAQGCDWLIDRWAGLADALESGRPWDDAQRSLAMDLLGTPDALRTGPTPADPGEGPDADAPQAALAAGRIAELSRLRDEVLAGRDEDDREAAGRGVEGTDGPSSHALRLVRRYEAACHRRMERSTRLLLSGRLLPRSTRDDAIDAEPTPRPVPDPPALACESPPPPPPVRALPSAEPRSAGPKPALAAPPAVTPKGRAVATVSAAVPTPTPTPEAERPRGNRRWRKAQLRQVAQTAR